MSENAIVTELRIDRVGPYGVQSNGVWYGVNRPLTPKSFVVGNVYGVTFKAGTNGKQYIDASSPITLPTEPSNITKAKLADTSPEYWDQKNRSQLVGGLFHDAAQITASLVMTQNLNKDDTLKTFAAVFEALLEYRDSLK